MTENTPRIPSVLLKKKCGWVVLLALNYMELWGLTSCGRRSCESVGESTQLIGEAFLNGPTQSGRGGKLSGFFNIYFSCVAQLQSRAVLLSVATQQPRRDTNTVN